RFSRDWSSDVCSSDLAADLHAGDTFLPSGDQAAERKINGLAAAPGGVELLAALEVDPEVVDVDGRAGLRFGAGSDLDVADDEVRSEERRVGEEGRSRA